MWTTIYINGRDGFKKVVLDKLKHSWMHGNSDTEHELLLFWLVDQSHLRNFKISIGSKIILKYRLYFFTNLDECLQLTSDKEHNGFSLRENKMIQDMETRKVLQARTDSIC